ncbi:MAG: glycosyltransferase family 4 protein [Prevotella sp.]|nr:glycosyltransferase family 4 protein [Prevotella sp.]
MRVLIINTSERTGGAAVAAHRLMEALNNNGVKVKMLVRDKETNHLSVVALPKSWRLHWNFLWERFCVWLHLHLRRPHLFDIDIANTGTDITKLREFQEADVIHLHWVNQGMLSLRNIRKILDSGKHVVWTMHDIWPATAICHLTLDCRRFETTCQQCRLLPGGGSANDLSTKVWHRKQQMLEGQRITFVACSRWLSEEARKSALLKGQTITSVPNPIDTRLYHPLGKQKAREELGLPTDGRLILFVSQRATNPYKGMQYLEEACQWLVRQYPDMIKNTHIAILGGHAEEVTSQLPFESHPLGYVNNEQQIVKVYNAADVFVLPSLSENLPNTIMEAMACGIPSIGFRIGGIPEEIDHLENGYVADYRDAVDLAKGIRWALDEADTEAVRKACLKKVARHYSQQSVAMHYIEVYEAALRPKEMKKN